MNAAPFLKPFESLINRNLVASTPARALLATLAGRAFAIEIETPLGMTLLRLRLLAAKEGLSVTTGDEAVDAAVTGTPFGLATLLARRLRGEGAAAGIAIRGDAEVASAFEQLFRHARPDLEEELARLVGELPAYYTASAARGLFRWGQRAVGSLARDIGEFLTEEDRDLVPRLELEEFLGSVERIREDLERLEARLALLAARLPQAPRA